MPRIRAVLASTALVASVAGCIDVPDLGERIAPDLRDAPFPTLIPLDASLTTPATPKEDGAKLARQLDARRAALQARARRLQAGAPPLSDDDRARLNTSVTDD
ncbi:MAG: hypothetical protein CML02_12665 [Pseudooceanicola sp.]|nr:hypothetical protein [Pseudooceanicola sp.]